MQSRADRPPGDVWRRPYTTRATQAWPPLLFCFLTVMAIAVPAGSEISQAAPESSSAADQGTDPAGRVGRLTEIEGSVSFRAAADTEWDLADPNEPATTGDRVWSDSDGGAEIELGDAVVRIWHETELDVIRLDDYAVQLGVPQGGLILRLTGSTGEDAAEIDAPNAVVTPTRAGEYRVDVSPDGLTTTVTVRSGMAEVTAAGSLFTLAGHQVATIHGDANGSPTYDVSQSLAADDFQQWSTGLDVRTDNAVAERQYVPSDMPGWEDLDQYGSWDTDDEYGPVWYPSQVVVGWAPYRFGHWRWFGVWGWTWVDDAPWGWAPFHYGRWASIHGRWGWCPGHVIAPAVFAPALVVFVGGASWNPAPAVGPRGGYGWFPLAPGEVYRPAYAVSHTYIRRVNVATVSNITTVSTVEAVNYRNRSVTNAVTVVPRTVFETGAPIARAMISVPPAQITRAPVLGATPLVAPTRVSVVGSPGGRRIVAPPLAVRERGVVALHAAPPAPPALSDQLRVIANNGGRPPTSGELRGLSASAAPVRRIQSAARTNGAQLKPVRPGLPTPHPVLSWATETGPATGTHVGTVSGPVGGGASSSLAASYAAQRDAQETRHIQEFANPPEGESESVLPARQESEDQALDQRYREAATSGRTSMPPRAPAPARAGSSPRR